MTSEEALILLSADATIVWANTIGVVNFAILLLVGWAFAHKDQVRSMRDRLRNRRRR